MTWAEEKGAKSSPRQQHKTAVEIMVPPFGTSGWKYPEILKEIKSAGYMEGLDALWARIEKNTDRIAI